MITRNTYFTSKDLLKRNISMNNTIILKDSLSHEDYPIALAEIKRGKKQSHWMWYIFPQALGLGYTSTSIQYGIKDLDEATAYLNHEVLGKRLIEISNALLAFAN